MPLFTTLLTRLIPLYIMIFTGWIAVKKLGVKKEGIANILIYLVLPVVIFNSVLHAKLSVGRLALPVLVFGICSLICLLTWRLTRKVYASPSRNIVAFTSGNANSGYFGFPAALALYGEEGLSVAVMISMGFLLYENTLGYYITARGHQGPMDALKRVLRIPGVYAFFLGLALNFAGVRPPEFLEEWALSFRATYTVLGMMIIGMGIADCRWKDFDLKFLAGCFTAKFLIWPALVLALIAADRQWVHLLDAQTYASLRLASALPMAANTVAIAAALRTEPEKASVAVLLSTFFGILFIPLFVGLFGG